MFVCLGRAGPALSLSRWSVMNVVRTRMQTAKRLGLMCREGHDRCVRPALLTDEDAWENYSFVLADIEHGRWDLPELVDRVRRGVKPMATILLRKGRYVHLAERVLRRVAAHMGLGCVVVRVSDGWFEGVVYQTGGVTLSRFFQLDEVAALYAQRMGVTLPRLILDAPLGSLAIGLAREDFDAAYRVPLVGLCLGYPVQETLRYMAALKTARRT
jgi:hypothetical protein